MCPETFSPIVVFNPYFPHKLNDMATIQPFVFSLILSLLHKISDWYLTNWRSWKEKSCLLYFWLFFFLTKSRLFGLKFIWSLTKVVEVAAIMEYLTSSPHQLPEENFERITLENYRHNAWILNSGLTIQIQCWDTNNTIQEYNTI